MAKKDLQNLSAEELFALAKQKEKEEAQREKDKMRAKVADLKKQRKELLALHNKAISEIDSEIATLTGGSKRGVQGRADGASAAILKALSAGEMDTKKIRAKLESQGIAVGNLPQTMAYLKRTGRVEAVARGVYRKA